MRDFFHWFENEVGDTSIPWLILGKGPSFSKRGDFDLSQFYTLALNHVFREQPAKLAHAIDIEVIEHCGDELRDNADFLVMPWVPHVRHRPLSALRKVRFKTSSLNLDEYCERMPVLNRMAEERRLLWYNLCTAPQARIRSGSPIVRAYGFSATAALNLLAEAGVKTVRSLGVDGGAQYSEDFVDLSDKTRLVAGQKSYNIQFEEIARTIMTTNVDFAPLDVETPIKVYVGTQPEQMLAMKVLEYSILKHASMSVEVIPLFEAVAAAGINIPDPKDPAKRPRTPFSFQRFAIPALKDYRGRAIYLDSDMQVFRDIKELWTWPFDGADLLSVKEPEGSGRRPQFSVMVLDCERLRWDVEQLVRELDTGTWTYEQFIYEMAPAGRIGSVLPAEWNDLERHRDGRTALTHYTDMNSQPWLTTENMLGRIWCEELFSAIKDDLINIGFVKDQVDRGWVRPSLLYQLEHDIVDPLMLPAQATRGDRFDFVPPHCFREVVKRSANYGKAAGFSGRLTRRTYATARHLWKTSGSEAIFKKVKRRLA